MRREQAVELLRESCAIAAVQVPQDPHLIRVIQALSDGGIKAVELPYTAVSRTRGLIPRAKENGILVGVGGITRSAQAREAGMLGADFVTAVVTAPDVVAACREMDLACILTGLTPTEVWRAQEMAADFVKVPAASLGGPDYIRSLREMLHARRLIGAEMPVDGFLPYLEAGVEMVEFKSSLTLPELAEGRAWAEISRLTSKITGDCATWRASRHCRQ